MAPARARELVSRHAVEALADALEATEDVAAAVDDCHLVPGVYGLHYFFCEGAEALGIEALA